MTSPIADILNTADQSNSGLSSSGNDVFNFNKAIQPMDNRSHHEAESNVKLLSSGTDHHFESPNQIRRQSLTPIPEMRLNDSPVNQNCVPIEASPHVELNTLTLAHDAKLPGEATVMNATQSSHDRRPNQGQRSQVNLQKSIALPHDSDLSLIRATKSLGKETLTSKPFSNYVDVTSHQTCTFEIPKHIDPASLKCRILTRYFVAVSGDGKHDQVSTSTGGNSYHTDSSYTELCELPGLPDESGLKSTIRDNGKVIEISVPITT